MALTKCPECGKEVSTYAVACPACGYPMGATGTNTKACNAPLRLDKFEGFRAAGRGLRNTSRGVR